MNLRLRSQIRISALASVRFPPLFRPQSSSTESQLIPIFRLPSSIASQLLLSFFVVCLKDNKDVQERTTAVRPCGRRCLSLWQGRCGKLQILPSPFRGALQRVSTLSHLKPSVVRSCVDYLDGLDACNRASIHKANYLFSPRLEAQPPQL